MAKQFIESFHATPGCYEPYDTIGAGDSDAFLGVPFDLEQMWAVGSPGSWGIEQAFINYTDMEAADDRTLVWGFVQADIGAAPFAPFVAIARAGAITHGVVQTLNKTLLGDAFRRRYSMLAARASGARGSETGYVALFAQPGDGPNFKVRIGKLVAGVYTELGSYDIVDELVPFGNLQPMNHLKFYCVGDALKAKFWAMGDQEPEGWMLEVTDSSITDAGKFGVGAMLTAWDTTSDDLYQRNVAYVSLCQYGPDDVPVVAGTCYTPKERAQRRKWFETSGQRSLILFEAEVLGSDDDGETGIDSIALFANGEFRTGIGDRLPNTIYAQRIARVGEYTQRMNELLQGEASQSFGDVVIADNNRELEHLLSWNWSGRPFRLLAGAPGWRYCDFIVARSGVIDRVEKTSSREISFKLRDLSVNFDRFMQIQTIGGSGPNADRPRPLTLGMVFNATPVLVDASTHRYKFHDGALFSINDVRENGNSIMGSVTTDLANGEFTLSAAPAGLVTGDPVIDEGSAISIGGLGIDYLSTFWSRLLVDGAGLPWWRLGVQMGRLASGAGSSDPYNKGVYIGPENRSVRSVLQDYLAGQLAYLAWSRWGEAYAGAAQFSGIGVYGDDSQHVSFVADDMVNRKMLPKRLIPPAEVRSVLVSKNYTVQDPSTLAGVLTEDEVALYSSEGTIVPTSSTPNTPALDNPEYHRNARQKDLIPSLNQSNSICGAIWALNWSHIACVYEFQTRKKALELEIGMWADVLHPEVAGFESGARGLVVGLREDVTSRNTVVEAIFPIPGEWPAVTEDYPVAQL